MPTPPVSSGKSLANSAADPVPATAVRDQLARVVNSPGLVSSARLCRFLTHIVNRTIDGDIDSLKEFSIESGDCQSTNLRIAKRLPKRAAVCSQRKQPSAPGADGRLNHLDVTILHPGFADASFVS